MNQIVKHRAQVCVALSIAESVANCEQKVWPLSESVAELAGVWGHVPSRRRVVVLTFPGTGWPRQENHNGTTGTTNQEAGQAAPGFSIA